MIDGTFTLTREHKLIVERCFTCRVYFAYEHDYRAICPVCACKRQADLVARAEKAERVSAALRGAISRAKKAKR